MSRIPIRIGGPRPGGPPAVPPGPAPSSSRYEYARKRDVMAEVDPYSYLRGIKGGSKKGSRGARSGIGRKTPTAPGAKRPRPAGPAGASFPSVRLPDRKRFSPTQQARRSVFGAVGDRLKRAAGLVFRGR